MSTERKKPEADLRKYHTIFLEAGLIITLLLFIIAAKVNLTSTGSDMDLTSEQEIVEMEDIVQTKQEETPPPPPRPPVPVEVPNDEVIEDEIINLDADLDLSESLDMPPPPGNDVEEEETQPDFFVAVEHEPELIGTLQDLQKKIEYPEKARRASIEGQVIVQFIVNVNGDVESPVVIRSVHPLLDEAAIQGIMTHAKFRPGQQRGEPVRVQFSLPIIFRLNN
ncbi:MAG: energy transducer TonB [Balneolaceae bacterium]|nr:energy transducer TonB [Balneolaceae bacterium]